MKTITGFFKGLFNFFVGDWIILIGVAVTLVVVALLENLPGLDNFRGLGGYLLFIGAAITLALTLRRETGH